MSDGATSGSAILAGNPAGDVAAAGNVVGGEAAANANWFDGFQDADLKGYVQNKGWKDPTELAVGYRNLEKLLGSEKVPLPKGAEDKEGWSRVYDALGRPKSADDYKLPVPDGSSPDFAKAAAGKFHELGLSASQAQALTEWYNGQAAEASTGMQQQSAQKSEADLAALRGEWGGAFNENVELGRRAAREFGLDADKLNAMEGAFGTGEMLKFMARIGRGLTEHTFEGGKTTQGFGMTPEAAQQRIAQLREDREWSTRYISGNADARAEMSKLMAVAYPE
jgi:hypothetical protein